MKLRIFDGGFLIGGAVILILLITGLIGNRLNKHYKQPKGNENSIHRFEGN